MAIKKKNRRPSPIPVHGDNDAAALVALGFFNATPLNLVSPNFRKTFSQANAGDVAKVAVEGLGTVRSRAVSPS